MSFKVQRAQPIAERLLIALIGPSGGGKTVSALRLATGIVAGTGKRIALIDTENKRSQRYAKKFDFDFIEFDPPFSSARYLEAFQTAEKHAGPGGVVIIDSMSHEHEGPGGMLDVVEKYLDDKAGNDYGKREKLKMSAFIKPKQARNKLIQFGLQRTPCHVILCFRAKDKIAMVKKSDGKTDVVNQGLHVIGGDEFAYEMSIAAVLTEGSQGRPDWTQKMARINDMDGPLRDLLRGTEQFTEETGRRIREICSVPNTPKLETTAPAGAADPKPETKDNGILNDQLLIEASKAAGRGTASFTSFWQSLSKDQRAIVHPKMSDYQSEAQQADFDDAQYKQDQTQG